MYIKLDDKTYPVSLADIRAANPELGVPDDAQTAAVEHLGYARVEPTERPVPGVTQHVVEVAPVEDEGVYRQAWQLVDWDADVIAMHLAEAKARKNAEINLWRELANKGTFTHAGRVIACDALSRGDIDAVANHISLFGTFPAGFPGAWKAKDNSLIPLPTIDAFKALFTSMAQQGTVNFNRSQQLKQQLAAAKTQGEIDAIAW